MQRISSVLNCRLRPCDSARFCPNFAASMAEVLLQSHPRPLRLPFMSLNDPPGDIKTERVQQRCCNTNQAFRKFSSKYSDVRKLKARIDIVVVLSVQLGKTLASQMYRFGTSWV